MKDKKHYFKLNVRWYFTIVIMASFAVIEIGYWFLSRLLDNLFDFTIYIYSPIWVVVLSIFIGGGVSSALNRKFFEPIMTLGQAMNKVTSGDFATRIERKSSFQEIQDIYDCFNLMAKELSATEILQTDFVSNVSHEFKTPINAIEGYATLLQGGLQTPEEQEEYVEKILFNTRRLSELAGNILLLSKVENQAIQTSQEQYRLDEQIRQAIVLLEPKWSEKEIEFDVDLEKIEYVGNEGLMFHVWSNLIGNAIKFNPQGGEIRMKLLQGDGQIIFTIEDNGPGIGEQEQAHIFDKFYQGDSSHKAEGNGLGLALVSKILDLNNGRIIVENIAQGGCRFTVVLSA